MKEANGGANVNELVQVSIRVLIFSPIEIGQKIQQTRLNLVVCCHWGWLNHTIWVRERTQNEIIPNGKRAFPVVINSRPLGVFITTLWWLVVFRICSHRNRTSRSRISTMYPGCSFKFGVKSLELGI